VDYETILEGLDDDQRRAVLAEGNAVVSAGAGSGKTKTLAARFASLVVRGTASVEEILTLTFTNKAANEMYDRIYRLLRDYRGDEKVRRALEDFHKAKISTLDSFCGRIARMGCTAYGLAPDFSSDETGVRDLAREASLRFVLDHRRDEGIQQLLGDHKIRDIAEGIFAEMVLYHSPLSSPPDLEGMRVSQGAEARRLWR